MRNYDQKSIDVLNNLLLIHNHRSEHYERLKKESEDKDLKFIFSQLNEECSRHRKDLIAEIHRLSGVAKEGTRLANAFFKAWIYVKPTLFRRDRGQILKTYLLREATVIKSYEHTLKYYFQEGTNHHHQLISKQYSMIKADYENVKNIHESQAAMSIKC